MRSDFIDNIIKEINSGVDKISSKVSGVIEITKIKNQINDLAKNRINLFAELGSLTYGKHEEPEINIEEDINKIIGQIKEINAEISKKKEELDKKIQEAKESPIVEEAPKAEYCSNCGTKTQENDNFCKNCGTKIIRE